MFEVQLISKTGAIQESFTAVLSFTSKSITGFSFVPVPLQKQEPGMHEIAFTTPYYLPASKLQTSATELVSFIKLVYRKHPTKTPAVMDAALGYGFSTPTAIPCKSLKGLNPINGVNINCTLYPGTEPYILVKNYGEVKAGGQILIFVPNKVNPTDWMEFDLRLITKQNRMLNLISVSPYTELRFNINTTCRLLLIQTLSHRLSEQVYPFTSIRALRYPRTSMLTSKLNS
jgi:hypothetical protein